MLANQTADYPLFVKQRPFLPPGNGDWPERERKLNRKIGYSRRAYFVSRRRPSSNAVMLFTVVEAMFSSASRVKNA